jgi:hypothetical protein
MCHIIFDYKYNSKNIVEKAFSYIFIGFIPNLGFEAGALCKCVLSVAFTNELKEELRGKAFSILIDETNDTSTSKILAVLVRHRDNSSRKMVSGLLGLVEVLSTACDILFQNIRIRDFLLIYRHNLY